jgi:uncharacterized OB-fold protein
MTTPLASEFAGFFEGAAKRRLCFPFCAACRRFHWYPMPRCPHCQSAGWNWKSVPPVGEIYSFTEVRHPFDPSRRDALPYFVGVITFAEAPGVLLITNLAAANAADLRIGQKVEPIFPSAEDMTRRVVFRPSAE